MLKSLVSNLLLSYLLVSISKTISFSNDCIYADQAGYAAIFTSAAPHHDHHEDHASSQEHPSTTTTTTAAATTTATTATTTATTTPSTTSNKLQQPPPPTIRTLVQANDQVNYLPEFQLEPSMRQLVVAPPPPEASQEPSGSPRSEKQPILDMFTKFFLKARSHDDQDQKELVRDGVILRLRELGFETSFVQKSRFEFRRKPAVSYNMISILPGRHRHTEREQIVLVGAHWDSATKAPGVDDNGSGSACLLEIARLISVNKCSFNHTIMLVWFDYEEHGKYGSEFFVNDYLFPLELEKYKSKFIGAYILDMILVRDKENNTQTLPLSLKTKLSDFFEELEREKNRGDFLATWSRRTWDEPLENTFRYAWQDLGFEARAFKSMRPELPQSRLPNSEERFYWKDFFRSDHASFWFPPLISTAVRRAPNRTSTVGHSSLNAILLTDLGPWRKSYQRCYHSACDDEHLLTDGNLAFMQQVVDTLVLTLMRVAQGECKALNGAPSQIVRNDMMISPANITAINNSDDNIPMEQPAQNITSSVSPITTTPTITTNTTTNATSSTSTPSEIVSSANSFTSSNNNNNNFNNGENNNSK